MLGMDENPYRAPQSVPATGTPLHWVRCIAAVAFLMFGVLIGIAVARNLLSIIAGRGSRPDVGIFVVSALTLAAVGCYLAAAKIAERDKKHIWAVVWLSVAAVGAWAFIVYAVISGWLE